MSKELPFFKFYPSEWLIGRISFQPMDIQGAFTQCCCMFWQLNGKMKESDIDFRIGKDYLQKLKDLGFVKEDEGLLYISFLDEQINEYDQVREKKKVAGANGGLAKSSKSKHVLESAKQNVAGAKQDLADAKQNVAKPSRKEEEKNKNKNKKRKDKREFIPPSLDEVKGYFKENGYSISVAERAFKGYSAADWHDTKGDPVLNWKQKMVNNWFKDENLEKTSNGQAKQIYTAPKTAANGPKY